jgi:uncharacterized protein YbaP (TraB family)
MRRGSCQARRSWLPVVLVLAACKQRAAEPLPTRAETRALADKACPAVTRPLFFKVEKDGRVSHLLGTRHVGVTFAKFPDPIEHTFRAAKTAVFESIAHAPDPEVPLETTLGETRWKKLVRLLGPGEAARVRNSAGLAIAALLTLYEDRSAFLDVELQQLARARGMELVALEDAAKSAELGRELASPAKLAELLDSLPDRATLRAATETGLRSYCSAGSTQDLAGPKSALDQIGERRVRAWLAPLVILLARGEVFVAVGSNHLNSAAGLPALLRAEGFTVTDLGQ